VLFVSGYPESGVMSAGEPISAGFLHKPFSPGALADKIRAVLGED
jgi:hypothetical protein